MTKANVIQLGFLLFLLGAIVYGAFIFSGFNTSKAEIASEVLLVAILVGWVSSYFLRVITGKMTFMEQRKRFREKYENIIEEELSEKLDLMSVDEKARLIDEINTNNNDN